MKLTKIREFANRTPELTIVEDGGTHIKIESPKKLYSIFYRKHGKVLWDEEFKSNGLWMQNIKQTQRGVIFRIKLSLENGF